MGVLSGLKPERVYYYFEEICKIPHGSYNVKGISDYCMSVARSLGLRSRQDEELNVVIWKDASEGYGDAPVLMIQGHMDMVAVKDADCDKDMMLEGLDLEIRDGYIRAKGTTLGGDDGIAVAMGLAILEDDTIQHPALEVVFTTQEEVGMDGAFAIDTSDLRSQYLLNLDSEREGHFLAGCAGGACVTSVFDLSLEKCEGRKINLCIDGLIGGHSGQEIDKCRANANILLGRLLYELHEITDIGIIFVEGGEKDNAIAVDACASICVCPEDIKYIFDAVNRFAADIALEFKSSDPDIRIQAEDAGQGCYPVFTRLLAEKVIFMLVQAPSGIQTMSADLPGLVETSLNLGILDTSAEGVKMTWAVRSSVKSLKKLLITKLEYMTEFLGGNVTVRGNYPEWPFNPDSKIIGLGVKMYERLFGSSPSVETVHCGVECGLLAEKMPGLDMISLGPDLFDIHTTRERMGIDSVERTWRLVLEILKEFKNYCR